MGSERMKKRVIEEVGALGLQKGLNSMYSSIIKKKLVLVGSRIFRDRIWLIHGESVDGRAMMSATGLS
jgi:hypothetical protein